MNRARSFQKMRKSGFSDSERAFMYGIAKKASREMEQDATERAFLYMLAIPLNVLVADGIINHDNAPEYVRSVMSLYESVENGFVSDQDLADLLHEYSGVTIEADWLEKKPTEDKDAVTIVGSN